MKRKKILFDTLLIATLLIISLISLLIIKRTAKAGTQVRVSVDGEIIGEYSLSENCEYSLSGGTNILVIENGFAYIKEANCKDKICVNTGKISHTGQRIVCLPNKLLVEVLGDGEEILGG